MFTFFLSIHIRGLVIFIPIVLWYVINILINWEPNFTSEVTLLCVFDQNKDGIGLGNLSNSFSSFKSPWGAFFHLSFMPSPTFRCWDASSFPTRCLYCILYTYENSYANQFSLTSVWIVSFSRFISDLVQEYMLHSNFLLNTCLNKKQYEMEE